MGEPSEQQRTPYFDAILAYAGGDPARFHVPGHKGGPGADAELRAQLPDALRLDIPRDMYGIDIGEPPTPYQQAEALAAEAHGAARTWFLTNGATQGNHAMALALAPLGATVVVQRNSHGSLVDGLVLSGGLPAFVSPEIDRNLGIAHGVLPERLADRLDRAPDARAVFVLSPTYYGTCADVAALAEVAHARDLPIVVDQSWGAHFGAHPEVPQSALQLGADAVLTSTHKSVGSFTQSAMLHVARESRVNIDAVERAVRLVRSTSPSSLLLSSLDAARRNLAVNGREMLGRTLAAVAAVRERIKATPGLDVAAAELASERGVHDTDPLRIVLDTRGAGQSGFAMSESLRAAGNVRVELATDAVVVLVVGIGDDPAQLTRLADAVERAAAAIGPGEHPALPIDVPAAFEAQLAVSPREAFLGATEIVEFATAEGHVCGESIAVYPPGIPALLPGERITHEIYEHLRSQVAKGARLHGASDPQLRTIHILPDAAATLRHR